MKWVLPLLLMVALSPPSVAADWAEAVNEAITTSIEAGIACHSKHSALWRLERVQAGKVDIPSPQDSEAIRASARECAERIIEGMRPARSK